MTLSDQLLHVYGQTDRPNANRCRAVPIVPTADNRPFAGVIRVVIAGLIGFGLLIGGLAVLWIST